jgi:hypothetical protein
MKNLIKSRLRIFILIILVGQNFLNAESLGKLKEAFFKNIQNEIPLNTYSKNNIVDFPEIDAIVFPSPEKEVTWAKFWEMVRLWRFDEFSNALLETYKDNEKVTEKLEVLFKVYSDRNFDNSKKITLLEEAEKAGCKDPLLYTMFAYTFSSDPKKVAVYIKKALPLFKKYKYPNFYKANAYAIYLWYSDDKANGKMKKDLINELVRSVGDEQVQKGMGLFLYLHLLDVHQYLYYNCNEKNLKKDGFYKRIRGVKNASPYVVSILEGGYHISKAWKARGTGWANTVTKSGWKGMREHLGYARDILTKAYNSHPKLPYAQTLMLTVTMGSGGKVSLEEWFQRGIDAHVEYNKVYSDYRYTISNRWGGSQNKQIYWALKLLETKRFDTRIPYQFLLTMQYIAKDSTLYKDRRTFYANNDVRALIFKYYDMRNEAIKKDEKWHKSCKAIHAWLGYDYKTANKYFDEVDKNIPLSYLERFSIDYLVFHREMEIGSNKYGEKISNALKAKAKKDYQSAIEYLSSANVFGSSKGYRENNAIFNLIASLEFTGVPKYDIWLAESLHTLRMPEKVMVLLHEFRSQYKNINETFLKKLKDIFGEFAVDTTLILPIGERHKPEIINEKMEELKRYFSESKSKNVSASDKNLAMLRLEVLGNVHELGRVKIQQFFKQRYQRISNQGQVLDFVSAYLERKEKYLNWYVGYSSYELYFRRKYNNSNHIKKMQDQLSKIEDVNEFKQKVEHYALTLGNPVYTLELGNILFDRKESDLAAIYKFKADRYLRLLNESMSKSKWILYHITSMYLAISGEEWKARNHFIAYEGKPGHYNSGLYMGAYTYIKAKNIDYAVKLLVQAKKAKRDSGKIFLAYENVGINKMYIWVIDHLKKSEKFTEKHKNTLRKLYPDAFK